MSVPKQTFYPRPAVRITYPGVPRTPAPPPPPTETVVVQQAGGLYRRAKGRKGGRGKQTFYPKKKQGKRPNNRARLRHSLNAFSNVHLPLPHPTAPYLVIRTTQCFSPTNQRFLLFGPSIDRADDRDLWTSLCAYGAGGATTDLMGASSAYQTISFSSLDSIGGAFGLGSQVAPSAFTVKIMNGGALSTTEGIIYMGRCKSAIDLPEQDMTADWQSIADNLIAYCSPTVVPASKLALKPHMINCLPCNMSQLGNFTSIQPTSGTAAGTLSSATTAHLAGMLPSFVVNPANLTLTYEVVCEWRVRFDPSNPAHAAAAIHKPASNAEWAEIMTGMIEGAVVVYQVASEFAPFFAV